jgi:hypothetical protein
VGKFRFAGFLYGREFITSAIADLRDIICGHYGRSTKAALINLGHTKWHYQALVLDNAFFPKYC